MKALYTVLRLHEDHWIAVKIDIEKCTLVVLDCNLQATPEGEIEAYIYGTTSCHDADSS